MNLKVVSPLYRARSDCTDVWADCTDVRARLSLYWWQRLITFSSRRIRVKLYNALLLALKLKKKKKFDFIIYAWLYPWPRYNLVVFINWQYLQFRACFHSLNTHSSSIIHGLHIVIVYKYWLCMHTASCMSSMQLW